MTVFSVLQATKSWAGPGNEAREENCPKEMCTPTGVGDAHHRVYIAARDNLV